MSEASEDQIHAATPTRQEQARRDGDIAKSFELSAAIQMVGAIAAAYLTFNAIGHWLKNWTTETWSEAGTKVTVDAAELTGQLQGVVFSSLVVLLPLMLLLFLIGIGSHWLQTGPMFLVGRVAPDPTRLASGSWRRHVFSLSSLGLLIVGIPKTVVAAAVLVAGVYYFQNEFFALANYSVDAMASQLLSLVLSISLLVASSLLAISGLDFWLKRLSYLKRLKMTDQQLRDELSNQNGNAQPRVRQRSGNPTR
ncbi:MAG: flagellar biosynthetic protein FlhB [Mariniblastus sp.]|jgi:flagellar biosynthetic protein FlhB